VRPAPAARAGCVLKAARLAKGHTQEDAAKAVGVRANTWARWERGEMAPRTKALVRAVLRYVKDYEAQDPGDSTTS